MLMACAGVAACSNKTAQAPNATAFRWPDHLAYRVDYVSTAQRDAEELVKFAETKTLRLQVRNDRYLGDYDSVLKSSQRPGQPLTLVPYLPEDTLAFYVKLGAHGELTDVTLGCDPSLPACLQALPSSVQLELRRMIPRLPFWEAPAGGGWMDTLRFDDGSRPLGARGSVVTAYTGRRDTIINGRGYWLIGWHSIRRAFRPGEGASPSLGAEQPVEEAGITLVDKRLLLPAYSTWAGAVVAPPELRALGATGSGFRGRSYLAGSVFDSLYSRQIGP